MRIFRLALTSCLHAVISTRKSHKGKWAGGEGGYKSSTTCLPLIPLVGAKVARTDQCRWISLRTYPRTYLSPPILRPRQVVNNHCVTTGSVCFLEEIERENSGEKFFPESDEEERWVKFSTVYLDCGKIGKKKRKEKEDGILFGSTDSRFRKNVSVEMSEGKGGFCVLGGGLSRLSP